MDVPNLRRIRSELDCLIDYEAFAGQNDGYFTAFENEHLSSREDIESNWPAIGNISPHLEGVLRGEDGDIIFPSSPHKKARSQSFAFGNSNDYLFDDPLQLPVIFPDSMQYESPKGGSTSPVISEQKIIYEEIETKDSKTEVKETLCSEPRISEKKEDKSEEEVEDEEGTKNHESTSIENQDTISDVEKDKSKDIEKSNEYKEEELENVDATSTQEEPEKQVDVESVEKEDTPKVKESKKRTTKRHSKDKKRRSKKVETVPEVKAEKSISKEFSDITDSPKRKKSKRSSSKQSSSYTTPEAIYANSTFDNKPAKRKPRRKLSASNLKEL